MSLCDLELGLILAQLAPKTLFFALTARELRIEQDDFLLMLIQSSSEPVNLSGPVLLEAGQLGTESLRPLQSTDLVVHPAVPLTHRKAIRERRLPCALLVCPGVSRVMARRHCAPRSALI